MKVKVINRSRFDLPRYATPLSAGMDVRANIDEAVVLRPLERAMIPTGLSIELPEGYEGDSFSFSDEVMEKTDVFLTPGGIFGSEGNGYIRITLCCPEELLKKATDNVVAAFKK